MNQKEYLQRYETQLLLSNMSIEKQLKLFDTKILVIGAGGLGSPCLTHLAASGIGHIGICDMDSVSVSNLNRQTLFTTEDIGKSKIQVAKNRLEKINPDCRFTLHHLQLDNQQAIELFKDSDLIIDCTDNFLSRLIINDACYLLEKPLIYAAIFQYQAQLAIFNANKSKFNLRDLFYENQDDETLSCNTQGTMGVITGMVGTMQALEAIKFILKIDDFLQDSFLNIDFLSYNFYKVKMQASILGRQKIPINIKEFKLKNYTYKCSSNFELSQEEFLSKIKKGNVQIIDVRNRDEKSIDYFQYEIIPIAELREKINLLDKSKEILLFCHSGQRSLTALEILTDEFNFKNIFHLKGGIIKWKKEIQNP